LISSLSNTGELEIRQKEYINTLLQTQGFADYARITPAIAGTVSKKLNADIFIYGIIQQAGPAIRVDAQLVDTKTKEVIKSFKMDRPSGEENIFQIIDTLSTKVRNFLMISEIMNEHPRMQVYTYDFRSPEVLKYVIYGDEAKVRLDYSTARDWYYKALAIDSNSFDANFGLWQTSKTKEDSLKILLKLYKKRNQMPILDQLFTNWIYAISFEPPGEAIKCLEQIQVLDGQNPSIPLYKANVYKAMNQYDKAIPLYKKSIAIFHKWGIKLDKAYAYLGEAYHKTGQYKMEKRLYKKAERNNPDHSSISFSWIIRNQATLALSEGDTSAANKFIEKFKSILKENSSSEADILNGLALIYWRAGNLNKAEEYYNKALSLEPDNTNRINSLANFLVNNNRHLGEVSELMNRAMELAPDKFNYYNSLDTKGWGFYKQGKYQEALDILQRTWDSAPFPLYSLYSHLEEVKKAVAAHN
jgi:tetratricopeptide (TPR) repeat protein